MQLPPRSPGRRGARLLAPATALVVLPLVLPGGAAAAPAAAVGATVVPGTPAPWLRPAQTRILVENLGDAGTTGPTTVVVTGGTGADGRLEGVGWSCGAVERPLRIGTCVRDAPLAAGERAPDIRLVATTDATNGAAGIGGTFSVRASVRTPEDGRTGDSSADRPVVRESAADATLVVDAGPPAPRSAPRTWTVRVANRGTAATGAPLRVALGSDGAPPAAGGDGWLCDQGSRTCLRLTPLAAGAAAPALTVRSVAGDPSTTLRAQVVDPGRAPGATDSNDGGGAAAVLTSDGGTDLAAAVGPAPGVRNTLAIDVRNAGHAATASPVTVAFGRADGSSGEIGAASGEGWDCTSRYGRCTTSASTAPGDVLPRITLRFRPRGAGGEVRASTRATVAVDGDVRVGNDTATGIRTAQPEDATGLDLDLRAPVAPAAGTDVVSTVLVRNPGAFATSGPVDVALRVPAGSTAGGAGWTCTRELRCRAVAPVAAAGTTPELEVRSPLPASPVAGPIALDATLTADGAALAVGAEATTGTRAGDVTVAFGPYPALTRAGGSTVVPVTVRTTGAMPVAGTTTVRLDTALDGRASGAGWSCGPALRGSRSCAHDGPVPVGGALPELSWELTAPDPLPGPVVAIAPVGGIRATVRAPAGTDADTTNDAATATPLAPAPVEAVVDLVGTWDALVPATTERTGRVSFVVTNTTGAAIPGSVAVRPFGWQGESGDGWRCADTCRYAGPLAAGATLPALRGAVVPAQRSDDSDTVRAVLLRPDGTRVEQYQAVLPAARGPVPTLSLGMGDSTLVQPGVPTTLRGSVAADLPVAGPVALRLDPDPGVVVERVTGATCTTALRCTVAGTSTTGRGISVVVRTATDVAGPLRLRGRLSAEGARPSDSSTVLVPRAAGGDLTSTLDGPPAALPGGAARLVQRIRNDGSETISGPIRAHAGNSDVYREVPGTTAAGWECERLSATCVHDGSLAPGDTLPPLVRTATAGVSTPAPPVVVGSSVEAVSDDDTVPENSGASTTVPAGSPASADVAISLAADGAPAPGGPSRFVARVRNVGDRATTAPVEVAFGSSLILPGGVVVPTPIFGGSVSFPDVPADGAPAWGCAVATQRCLLRAPLGPGESAPALPVRRAAPLIGAAPAMQAQAAGVTSGSDAARSTTATASVGPLPQSASDVAVAVGTAEPAVRGRTIRHEIRVVNLGTARSVEPVEVEVAAVGGQRATVSGAGWTCPVGGRVCRLTGDVLDAGDAAPPLTAEIEENGSSPDDRGLTATVSGDGDPPAGNDRSTASVLQQRSPDGAEVGVAFDGTTPTPYDGPVRGRLRVAHVGTGAPAGPVVVLLAGVDDAGADGWTCEATATRRQRRCTAADVPAPGAQLPAIDVESRAPADPWTASVVSPGPGRYAAASVVPSVGRPPVDLGIALSGGDPLADGDETTLVATVHNGGSRTTSSATTVLLAAPTTVDLEARGSDWECDAQACTTRREVVPGGRLPELRVRVRPQGRDGARPATIGVGVVHPGDQVAVDDTATATVGVGAGRVDLAPAVSSDGVLRPGLATRTVVRVRNVGAGATDRPTTLDVEAPFGGTLAGEGWTCAELRCRRDGPVLPLADLPPVVLTAITPADAPLDRVTTSASVTNDADGTSTDDRASSSRGVGAPDRTLPRPSAAVDVGLPVPSGAPGDVVPVQVAILGPDVARTTPARTRLTLPEGLSFAGVPAGDPAPASDGRTLTWDLPLPADRAAESWTVLARVDDGATPGARRPSATLAAAPFATPETAAATFVVTAPPEPPAPADGSAGPGPPPAGSTAPGPAAPGPAPSQSDPDAALAAFLAALGRPAPTPPAGLGPGTSRPAAPARPTVRLTTLRPPRTSALTRSGWAVRVRQTGGATARASLVVDRATARRLRVRAGTAVATGRATLRRPGAATVVLRVPAGLRARVRRAARVTGTLEVVVRSASGSARAARRVTVTR